MTCFLVWDDPPAGPPTPAERGRMRAWYEMAKRDGRITERTAPTADGRVTFTFITGSSPADAKGKREGGAGTPGTCGQVDITQDGSPGNHAP